MKKLMTVCLCLLLIAAMATSAFAANGAAFSAKASAETLYRGDTVTLTVNVTCDEKATSYGLMLNFDEALFELVDGSCTVTGTLVSSFNNGFAFMFQNPTAYSGAVGTVTLKVKDDAAFGAATVTGEASVKNGTEEVAATGCAVSLTVACKHTYGAWTEAENGHTQTCSICGDVKTAEHNWDKGITVKEATCTEEGAVKYTCTACAATKEEAVAVLAHAYGAWESLDEENHKHVCANCQAEETAAHAFTEELTAGEKTHWNVCACGAKANETEHTFGADWSKNEKTHWHICACGAKADEADHAWDDGKITVEPTRKKEGVKTFTCKDCAQTKTEKIAKLPAKPQNNTEKNPQTGDMTVAAIALFAVLSACGLLVCVADQKKMAQ